jgi:hypothetical protein
MARATSIADERSGVSPRQLFLEAAEGSVAFAGAVGKNAAIKDAARTRLLPVFKLIIL